MREHKISQKALAILIAAALVALVGSFVIPAFAASADAAAQTGENAGIFASITEGFEKMKTDVYNVLIKDSNYKHITNGLGVTVKITLAALLIGLLLGFFVAIIRSTHDKTGKVKLLNAICKLYLTVFRGTPVIVQLLIIYYLWLGKMGVHENYAAIIAFGLNSGAYVAEIVRSGIMSIDNGQFEAGRSLGFNYFQTMRFIVIPQMFKAVLPTLCNEFIALLKETSVAGYVGVTDLTKAGNTIAGRTYSYFIPLITVAIVYLVLVMVLSYFVGRLERRLRKSER